MFVNVLKNIWLHAFKCYLRLGLFFYFRRIKTYNLQNLPKDESVLILCNHQNALLDALLIATTSNRFVHFLTRASVFKKSLVDKFLRSLQMLPVYRIRDGWNNLTKNNEIFENCSYLLVNKEAVVIFPEGSHNLKRAVRPLSKGFTRIVFETLDKSPDTELKLLPVGLNFKHAKDFKDSVSIYFGEPFLANSYLSDNFSQATINLKQDVQSKISELTTNIPLESYDETLQKLEELQVDFLKPEDVNKCIESGFRDCVSSKNKNNGFLFKVLKGLLILLLSGPYLIWKLYLQPKIVEQEFTSTFRFAIAVVLVPLWLIIVGLVLVLTLSWSIALWFIVFVLLLELITVKL